MAILTFIGWGLLGVLALGNGLWFLKYWEQKSLYERELWEKPMEAKERERLLRQAETPPDTTPQGVVGLYWIIGTVVLALGLTFLIVRFIHWAWYL